jgi:post-segregation antitoxin (ccd killing protein)
MRMATLPTRKRRASFARDRAIRVAEQGRWLSRNEQAIEEYNAFVERHGAFSDDFAAF